MTWKMKKRVIRESSMPVLRGIPSMRANTGRGKRSASAGVEITIKLTAQHDGKQNEEHSKGNRRKSSLYDTVDGCWAQESASATGLHN